MPLKRGLVNNRPELKYTNWGQNNIYVPCFTLNAPNYTCVNLAAVDPNQVHLSRGTDDNSFIGTKINLISMDITMKFTFYLTFQADPLNWNWPNTNGEWRTWLEQGASNFTPRVRVSWMWDKRGKEVGDPTTVGTPQIAQGFLAPFDHDYYKVIEDKIYSMQAPVYFPVNEGQVCTFGAYQSGIAKTTFYLRKRIPLRMTATMTRIADEENLWVPEVAKRLFCVVTTDMPWTKIIGGAVQPSIMVTEINNRLWFKDP